MVRIEDNKLIIEIKLGEQGQPVDCTPGEKLEEIRNGIFEAIKCFNYKEFGTPLYQYGLLELLEDIMPTVEQEDKILKVN